MKDFEKKQKIDESKIICNICKQQNKSNSFDKEFFICLNYKKNLFPLCKSFHDINHNIIKYEQKNYICFEHEDNYSSYCYTCKKNLCSTCENEHSQYDIISLGKLFPNKKDLNKRMDEFKDKIVKLKKEIHILIDILNAFINNIEIFYNINQDINNTFNNKLKNYEILNNIKEINNINVLEDISKVINENNNYDKFKQILNIYNLMNSKDNSNEINNLTNINFGMNNMSIINSNNIFTNNMLNNNILNINMLNNNNILNNNNDINMVNNNNYNQSNFNNNINQSIYNNNFNQSNLNNNNQNMINNKNNCLNPKTMNINRLNPKTFNTGNNINNNNLNHNIINNNYNNINQNIFNNNLNNYYNNQNFQSPNTMYTIKEEEWMKGFKMAVEETYISSLKDYNCIFKTSLGFTTNIIAKSEMTIDQLLKKYLEKENKKYLIGNNNSLISFVYNGKKIFFGDNTLVKNYFVYGDFSIIIVNDPWNLIKGKEKNITFKNNKGFITKINFSENLSMNELLIYYFKVIDKENLIGNNNINFFFNGKKIYFIDMNTKVGKFFNNKDNPKIIVNDPKNLI